MIPQMDCTEIIIYFRCGNDRSNMNLKNTISYSTNVKVSFIKLNLKFYLLGKIIK